jgi:hypothetical protein
MFNGKQWSKNRKQNRELIKNEQDIIFIKAKKNKKCKSQKRSLTGLFTLRRQILDLFNNIKDAVIMA